MATFPSKFVLSLSFALFAADASSPALAAIEVFACEPEWAALAGEIGGDRVSVFAATTAKQNPHQIQARPSLIAKMRQADFVICTGAELELGWLPLLLRQASNGKVQPGTDGYFEATSVLRLKEIPAVLDRSLGDVHAAGNPHVQTDPRNLLPVAAALADRLARIDAGGAGVYRARAAAFAAGWRDAVARWEAAAAPLRGAPVLVQHKSWVYLLDWLGMREVAPLEPKPGIAPSASYLADVLRKVEAERPRMTLVAAYEDERPGKWMAEHGRIPAVSLPFTVGGTPQSGTLTGLYQDTVDRLLAGLSRGGS
jgi:zinc/manganese transport system substrate-binding protein